MMRGGLSTSSKRKNPTPRAKTEIGEDVWDRAINGSKLLNKSESLKMATAEGISPSSTPDPSLAQGFEKKRTIFDLPLETQKEIFKYVGSHLSH
jgi:hypothetical protein